MNAAIFKSAAGRQRLVEWFDRFLARIDAPVERRIVPTSLGSSHVLVAGDPANPPLLCLHGALGSSAHGVAELGPLLNHFQVFAPDVPGQSVHGPAVRLPFDGHSHARWLVEVLDALRLESALFYGASWGGFVALQTAMMAPRRVARLVLLAPAGFVTGSVWKGITQAALPLLAYRLRPSPRRLRLFVRPLLTTLDDGPWEPYLGEALQSFVLDFRAPPLATLESLRSFTVPTLIFGAADDLSFPGEKLLARVKELIPHAEVELLVGCKHVPPTTDEFRKRIADRILRFAGRAAVSTTDRDATQQSPAGILL